MRGHIKLAFYSGLTFLRSSVPLLTDADFFMDELSSSLFPGVPSSVKVHNGFGDAHTRWDITVDHQGESL